MSEMLFIYGTLHPDRAPREIASVVSRLTRVSRATIYARLLDLGEYSGIVFDANAAAAVSGELFIVPDEATLAALDAYEDYRPDDIAGSLFLRRTAVVTLDDGSERSCWVYVYNK